MKNFVTYTLAAIVCILGYFTIFLFEIIAKYFVFILIFIFFLIIHFK